MSLSLSTTMRRESIAPALFMASYAMPADMAPAPIRSEIGRQRACRRRDRHVVVVEHDDEARIHRTGIVHGLVRHAGRHGAVADDGDDIILLALQIAGDGHAEAGGN